MSGSQEGHALTIGDQQQVVPITFPDQTEKSLRGRLSRSGGKPLSVRISPAEESDVEGHALDSKSVSLNLQLEGDDTEGHAIRVHFPTADDADRFRRNVLLAGVLAGTIVIGSAGAIAITSNPATPNVSAPVDQSQVYERPALQGADIATGINPATGKPWRSGFQERADGELTGPGDAAPPTFKHPAGSGPLESVE